MQRINMARILMVALAISVALAMVNARLMNKREHIPEEFELVSRTNAEQMHEFRIALKQKNLDILEATLLEVSDPDSPKYGKWWTSEQILDLIAPSIFEIKPVVAWLKSFDEVSEIDVSSRDFIKVKATIRVIEEMFETQMFEYRSRETGTIVSRVFGSVHIPDSLSIIDMIMGLTELVPKSVIKHSERNIKRSTEQMDPLGVIYPGHLRKMYKIPSEYAVNKASSFGVAEFQNDTAFLPSDITQFNQVMNEKVVVSKIVGPFANDEPDGDSTMEVQYGAAIALNTTFWYWTVTGWMYEFATDLFNAKSYPLVVSMSWGWPEDWQCNYTACATGSLKDSFNYVKKVNVEFMKIGLKGITLLAASGDAGAPGYKDGDVCSGIISSIFPGASPWVTSVGSTMLVPSSAAEINSQSDAPPVCQKVPCANATTEGVCTSPAAFITSGGGFSLVSPVPGWQKDFVNNYLNIASNLPTSQFNASNRAFPDVAANAHNHACFVIGYVTLLDSSSASTPVFGAVIALLNSYMMNHGKTSLGFANPLLYKMYAADKTTFTDITTGNNYCTEGCCGNVGFVATKGWDAVTGLGTPMFPRMQEYLRKNVVAKN